MSNIDLDIKNYNLQEIEEFFKLKKGYTVSDLEEKAYKIREILLSSDNVKKEFKRDVIVFCTAAKQWLLFSKFGEQYVEPLSKNENRGPIDKDNYQLPPTTVPKYNNLNPTNIPIALTNEIANKNSEVIYQDGKPFIYTDSSEFFKGTLNPLNTRIINKTLSIDTKYRQNFDTTKSSDFSIQLPSKINKVVSMQLSNIEFPMCFYNVSENYGNNYLFIYLNTKPPENKEYTKTIIVPDGIYSAIALVSKINALFAPNGEDVNDLFSFISLSIDIDADGNGTGKTFIVANNQTINMIGFDFTRNKQGIPEQIDYKTKIGWNLGFIKKKYFGKTQYTSETVTDVKTIKYIYLAVDDYQKSVNNLFLEPFNNSTINENILARISLSSEDFTVLMENLITEPRKYFGPVDLQRLKIQLFDDHGRILDMNNCDYSFVINLKLLYDI